MRAFRGSDHRRYFLKIAEWFWESQPERVKAPYVKADETEQDPEYRGTRGIPWEAGGTTLQA